MTVFRFFNAARRSAAPALILTALAFAQPCARAEAVSPVDVAHAAWTRPAEAGDGVLFRCTPKQLDQLRPAMHGYLHLRGIDASWLLETVDQSAGTVRYVLSTPPSDTDTLGLAMRPEYGIHDDRVELPLPDGRTKTVTTVSEKEIVLALMQHGRLTEFAGSACDIEAFRDHVAVRQNIVAWAESLEWDWPDGGPAKWNSQYWQSGTPKPDVAVDVALRDAFFNQSQYGIGCYTASKLLIDQGIVDYYRRVKQDLPNAELVESRLLADKEPLVDVEPGVMWDFEQDYDPAEKQRPGKLLRIQYGVAPGNFVPGDWSYFVNTDPASRDKTGYEGSNAIYLGRNRFDDYYNDNHHGYTYKQKLDEVWQWRHGVFSRSRDAAKIEPLTETQLQQLSMPPSAGGLLMDLRVSPYLFGFEPLPKLGQ